MKIRNLIRIATVLLAVMSAASCDDPDNLYGKKKEMQILDEKGEPVEQMYVSIITSGTLSIVGGMGDNHTVEVQDESILKAEYNGRGTGHSHIPTETLPASVVLLPHKLGSTVVSITDNDTDETLHVQIDVVHQYIGLTVSESTAEELEDGTMILFLQDRDVNEYRIVSRNGKEYETLAKGEYHFEEPREDIGDTYINPGDVRMTLKDEDGETVWKITDADNNKNAFHGYISDVLSGLGLPDEIITKEPAMHYPELFLFTDIFDVNRHFMTGRMEVIEYTFN
ncbi:MAG: hypothetical protein IJV84_08050 [Bacteroidales bacterium]|nr:hypothetical protein [Bacteroidales bacterium]MBQ9723454.1 hypothetical protein [Bacteroidales bacterium]